MKPCHLACFTAVAVFLQPFAGSPLHAKQQEQGGSMHEAETTSRLATAFQIMMVSQNQCIDYSYDLNGNRINQKNTAGNTPHPTCGSASYLCFVWSTN